MDIFEICLLILNVHCPGKENIFHKNVTQKGDFIFFFLRFVLYIYIYVALARSVVFLVISSYFVQ